MMRIRGPDESGNYLLEEQRVDDETGHVLWHPLATSDKRATLVTVLANELTTTVDLTFVTTTTTDEAETLDLHPHGEVEVREGESE